MTTILIVQEITLVLYPVIYIMGITGNFISLMVFSRKKFKNTLFEVYFRVLSVVDTFTLMYVLVDFINYKYGINLYLTNYTLCKLGLYLVYVVAPMSGWILVTVSFDRMVNVLNPSSLKFRNEKLFQIGICLFILIYNLAFYSPLIMFTEYKMVFSNETKRNESNESLVECNLNDNGLTYRMDFFNSTLFPFCLMISFSLITIKKLFTSKNRIRSISPRDIRFAFTSLSLDFAFLVLNLPISLYLFLANYLHLNEDMDNFLYVITSLFFYIDFGIIFYVNIVVNSLFKEEFMQLKLDIKRRFFGNCF